MLRQPGKIWLCLWFQCHTAPTNTSLSPTNTERSTKTFDKTHRCQTRSSLAYVRFSTIFHSLTLVAVKCSRHAFHMMKRKKRTGRSQALPQSRALPGTGWTLCEDSVGQTWASIKDFRLDLRSSGLASAWKQRGTQIFVHHFRTQHILAVTKAIENAFKTHLITLNLNTKIHNNEDEPAGALAEKARQQADIGSSAWFHIH